MKKTFAMLFLLTVLSPGLSAQKLIIGEKAPDLKPAQWLDGRQPVAGVPSLIEFFFSPSEPSRKRLPVLDDLAIQYQQKLNVIVIAREPLSRIEPLMRNYVFLVAVDDHNKTFGSYGVQFVPFSVLLDGRGRVVWFGNSSQLGDDQIRNALKP